MARTTDVLEIKLQISKDGNVTAQLVDVAQKTRETGQAAKEAAGGMDLLGKAIAGLGIAKMVQQMVTANREAEVMRTTLKRLEGSQAAATERFRELQQVTLKTPYTTQQVTESYIRLKKMGMDPLDGTMQSLIDTASSVGNEYGTLTGLVDTLSRAWERNALTNSDLEKLMQQGIPVYEVLGKAMGTNAARAAELAKSGDLGRDAIKSLIDELGRANFGAAADQAGNLDGAIGGLKESFDMLAVALGDSGATAVLTILIDAVAEGLQVFADMVVQVDSAGDAANGLAAIFQGLYTVFLLVIAGGKTLGAGVGVLVDHYLALVDAARAAMIAVTGYYQAVGQALTGDFSGAANTVKTSMEGTAQAFESANNRIIAAHQAFGDTYDDISGQLTEDLNRLKGAANDTTTAMDGVAKAGQAGAGGLTVLTDAMKTARSDADRLIASLQRAIDTHGKSETQILREEAARLKAAGATKAQSAALDDLVKTYEALVRQDAAVDAMMASYVDVLDAAANATRDFDDLLRDQARELGGPYVEAALKYAAAMEVIAAKERALALEGKSVLEITEAVAGARKNAIDTYVKDLDNASDATRRAAMRQVDGFGKVWLQGIADLAPALADGLLSGDWDDVGKRLVDSILGGMIEALVTEQVVKPLQDAMMGSLGMGGGGAGGAAGGAGGGGASSGWNAGRIGSMLGGGMMVYQANQSGSWLQGAAGGAMAGASFGPWGMAIGAIAGALAGALGGSKDPYITVGGVGRTSNPRTTFTTAFGNQQMGVRGGMPMEDFITKVRQFDQSIAAMIRSVGGGSEEIEAISRALSGWSLNLKGGQATMENLLNERLTVIIRAAEPAWAGFINQIAGVQERIDAFTALYAIRDQIEDLDDVATSLSGGPLEQLQGELRGLNKGVDDSIAALNSALQGTDPGEIERAAADAQAAIVERYQREIEMVQTLAAALDQVEQQARAMDLMLSQRIAGLVQDWAETIETARIGIITSQASVQGSTDPERALAYLDEFIGNVDAWLAASINQVQRLAQLEQDRINVAIAGLQEQIRMYQQQLADLAGERAEIDAAAQARAQIRAEAQAALDAARQAAQQAHIEALRDQLDVANQWVRILDQARSMIEQMTFSATNPLGAQARLALLNQEIDAAQAGMEGLTGADQAAAATRLIDLLNQRLQLVQGEGLMQRPGADYLDLYNETLRQLAGVSAVAAPEADLALQLQEELNAISNRTYASVSGISTTLTYTHAEQTRLAEIAEEEARINEEIQRLEEESADLQTQILEVQRDAATQVEQLNKEAAEYYRWAREEAARINDERAELLQQQIDVITGGRPIDQFIASRQVETVDLLTTISNDLRAFLESISSGAGGVRGGGWVPPGDIIPPRSPVPSPDPELPALAPNIVIHTNSDNPAAVAAAVSDALLRELPAMASALKREMSTA